MTNATSSTTLHWATAVPLLAGGAVIAGLAVALNDAAIRRACIDTIRDPEFLKICRDAIDRVGAGVLASWRRHEGTQALLRFAWGTTTTPLGGA